MKKLRGCGYCQLRRQLCSRRRQGRALLEIAVTVQLGRVAFNAGWSLATRSLLLLLQLLLLQQPQSLVLQLLVLLLSDLASPL
jgi:hypothetical protein